jgi:hypothetical protein
MAEKNFFDLLKDKMAELRPSEKHRASDWAAMGGRLNTALPQPPRERRRTIVLPLLLLAALLSSNAAWWKLHQEEQGNLAQLKAQLIDLQTSVSILRNSSQTVKTHIQRDTIWRTVYLRVKEVPSASVELSVQNMVNAALNRDFPPHTMQVSASQTGTAPEPTATQSTTSVSSSNIQPENIKQADASVANIIPNAPVSLQNTAAFPLLAAREIPRLKIPPSAFDLPEKIEKQPELPTKPYTKKVTETLKPRFFKIGINGGWLYASSPSLMHEGGGQFGFMGQVGFSRHISVSVGFNSGRLHYKAHDAKAILGAPALPQLSAGHHFLEMDVTGQRIRQMNLGLRYTFAQPGKPRPFVGLGWTCQMILPFNIDYEIQHESSGMIEKGTIAVETRKIQRNIAVLNGGFDVPLSPRFDLSIEGFYQRQWKKTSRAVPDLTGVRAGINWLF